MTDGRSKTVVLDDLVELANILRARILAMLAEEEKSAFIHPWVDRSMRLYSHVLRIIQKMRFDLGLDEYKGRPKRPLSWNEASRQREREQAEIYKAYHAADEILKRRGIP
jgi:hypothetical protein